MGANVVAPLVEFLFCVLAIAMAWQFYNNQKMPACYKKKWVIAAIVFVSINALTFLVQIVRALAR